MDNYAPRRDAARTRVAVSSVAAAGEARGLVISMIARVCEVPRRAVGSVLVERVVRQEPPADPLELPASADVVLV